MSGPESPAVGLPTPLPQQLDAEGRLHDLAPQTAIMRLFEHEPQLPGQLYMDTDANSD
jgi:hypothetical protein